MTGAHDRARIAPENEVACLSPNVAVLGIVSLLMGMSSAMIYGLLPVFLVTILGASVTTVGLIEGIAEATTSAMKIFSGATSDWIGRRKPLVVFGYALSAVNKLLFPLAESASTVLIARIADRIGKGIRDAPRDALLADMTPSAIRGSGFGLRFALYTIGAVTGPLAAIALMALSADDFRLVFWIALLPGFASIGVLLIGVKEPPNQCPDGRGWLPIRRKDLALLSTPFWWAISIAAIFSLARFSPAFLVLKAHDIGIDAAFVPIILVIMYAIYSAAAYPFGILADHVNRSLQLGIGSIILVCADVMLAGASTIWMTALGALLWGLQMGVTQGLLSAAVADAAPERLRGTAFGILDLAVGLATFAASAGAGVLWTFGGPAGSFIAGAALAAVVTIMLLFQSMPKRVRLM
jgi:MFS family permease